MELNDPRDNQPEQPAVPGNPAEFTEATELGAAAMQGEFDDLDACSDVGSNDWGANAADAPDELDGLPVDAILDDHWREIFAKIHLYDGVEIQVTDEPMPAGYVPINDAEGPENPLYDNAIPLEEPSFDPDASLTAGAMEPLGDGDTYVHTFGTIEHFSDPAMEGLESIENAEQVEADSQVLQEIEHQFQADPNPNGGRLIPVNAVMVFDSTAGISGAWSMPEMVTDHAGATPVELPDATDGLAFRDAAAEPHPGDASKLQGARDEIAANLRAVQVEQDGIVAARGGVMIGPKLDTTMTMGDNGERTTVISLWRPDTREGALVNSFARAQDGHHTVGQVQRALSAMPGLRHPGTQVRVVTSEQSPVAANPQAYYNRPRGIDNVIDFLSGTFGTPARNVPIEYNVPSDSDIQLDTASGAVHGENPYIGQLFHRQPPGQTRRRE